MKSENKFSISEKIIKEFGNRLRIRVCGLCIEDGKLLLVNHHSLNENGDFWGPPGGGMDYGFSAEENLKREFHEETGLHIEIESFLFVHEYLNPPLHAIELLFKVRRLGGELKVGYDPEMRNDEQIIKNVDFIEFSQLKNFEKNSIHQMFLNASDLDAFLKMNGFIQCVDKNDSGLIK